MLNSVRETCSSLSLFIVLNSIIFVSCHLQPNDNDVVIYGDTEPELSPRTNGRPKPPRPGWVDPFDMLGENQWSSDSLFVQSEVDNYYLEKRFVSCETYLRLFVNLLLEAADLKESSHSFDASRFVKLEFLISESEQNILRRYGQNIGSTGNNIDEDSVAKVLKNIFSQSKLYKNQKDSTFHRSLKLLNDAIAKILRSPEWTVVTSISLLLCLVLWFVYKTHSYRQALFTLCLTVFVAGFGFNWMRMYEEKEVERFTHMTLHGQVPYHCSGQQMVWYEHMFYRMFGVDCLKFFKIRDVRPMVKISPTDVLAETFSSMIINPAIHIGKAYGNFVTSVIGLVPWWMTPIAVPLCFVMPIVSIILILALFMDYHLTMSWTGFHLIPNWSKRCCSSSCNSNVEGKGIGNKYVEEISHGQFGSRSKNISNDFDENNSLNFMSQLHLKNFVSSILATKIEGTDDDKQAKKIKARDSNEENLQSSVENISSEEASISSENSKEFENCKKRTRTIYTSAERSSHSCCSKETKDFVACDKLNLGLASGDHKTSNEDEKKTDCKD